jgi:hypothetical protein
LVCPRATSEGTGWQVQAGASPQGNYSLVIILIQANSLVILLGLLRVSRSTPSHSGGATGQAAQEALGPRLSSSWACLELILGCLRERPGLSWPVLGLPGSCLQQSWAVLEALGQSWPYFGCVLSCLEPVLSLSRAVLGEP